MSEARALQPTNAEPDLPEVAVRDLGHRDTMPAAPAVAASVQVTPTPAELVAAPGSRRMRLAQWAAVTRIELKRQILRRRAFGAMVLALLPMLMFGGWVLLYKEVGSPPDTDGAHLLFAGSYQAFILNIVIFFGCVVIFSTLLRREMRDRTLHYHFLSPVRREILLLGKYTAGTLTGILLFGLSTLVAFTLSYLPFLLSLRPAETEAFFLDGPGFAHLGAYLLVTALAVIGYGAVFLTLGMFFKNPVVPALAVYGWEMGNFLLPAALKQISVVYYLVSLLPVPIDDGPFALLAETASPWLAIPGLLLLSAGLVALAAWKLRRQEILYGED